MASLDLYPWSGHSVIVGNSVLEGQAVDHVLSLFHSRTTNAVKRYRSFVADGVVLGKRQELGGDRGLSRSLPEEAMELAYDSRILGRGEFVEELRQRRELSGKFSQHLEVEEIVVRVCRHYGMDPGQMLLRSRTAGIAEARSVVCYIAVRLMGHNGVEVGKKINLRRAGVSVAARRGEMLVSREPVLLALVDK